MNGKITIISNPSPFVPSSSKDYEKVFYLPAANFYEANSEAIGALWEICPTSTSSCISA
jgi:hypothetical protein